jgi:hypothetical protein
MSKNSNANSTAKKLDPKAAVCKELGCTDPAQVNGFCRLHFLKVVKSAKTQKSDEDAENAKARARNNRRRGNRFMGVDSLGIEDEEAPQGLVENMGNVNIVDLTAMVDVDDVGALPSPGADIDDDYKKTG